MEAHRCDRCGMFYVKNERFSYNNVPIKDVFVYGISVHSRNKCDPFFSDYELCDECLKEFVDWFESGNTTKLPFTDRKEEGEKDENNSNYNTGKDD